MTERAATDPGPIIEIACEVVHFLISHVEMSYKLFVNVKSSNKAKTTAIAKVCSIICNPSMAELKIHCFSCSSKVQ